MILKTFVPVADTICSCKDLPAAANPYAMPAGGDNVQLYRLRQ